MEQMPNNAALPKGAGVEGGELSSAQTCTSWPLLTSKPIVDGAPDMAPWESLCNCFPIKFKPLVFIKHLLCALPGAID
jgi:hypothetical protein